MLNGVTLIGRLKNNVKIEKNEDGEEYTIIVLSVPRTFPEKDGSYKSDLLDVKIVGEIASKVSKMCKKEDLIGIKGFITTKEPNKEHSPLEIIADKVSFLSNGNNK